MSYPRLRPVGDSAVTLELGALGSPALAARARALWRRLEHAPFPGYREALATARTLLAIYAPAEIRFDEVCARLLALLDAHDDPPPEQARRHDVPTVYGGAHGPDLSEVAARCGLSEGGVVALHAGREYEAAMIGFTAGFPYLGPLPDELRLPRRATPRPRVAAGSVAIAAAQTAIYPLASPGGWHVIGRTKLQLFDPRADPPVRILPGDHVRFVPVDTLSEAPAPEAPAPPEHPAIEVLEGGLLTTVQDGGRPALRRFGIGTSGALDPTALAAANLALQNPAGAAGLECTLVGPTLRFLDTTRFALCGADLSAELRRGDLGAWPVPLGTSVLARAGNVLAFGERRSGMRAYLALAGGLDVPVLLGSRATDVKAGFGGLHGRPLRAGDRLALGRGQRADQQPPPIVPEPHEQLELRVVLGPQDDHFAPETIASLLSAAYTLGSDSDRFGARLDGPRLATLGAGEIDSDAVLPGCIQVPPDGRPIVALAEGPTTGGYPKIATLCAADVRLLAQALPGRTRLRFHAVSLPCSPGGGELSFPSL